MGCTTSQQSVQPAPQSPKAVVPQAKPEKAQPKQDPVRPPRVARPPQGTKKPKTLIKAAKTGDLECVKTRLAEDGCDVNMRGMWESTPLIVACQYRNVEVALTLCDTPGVDITLLNEKGASALLLAAMEGLEAVVTKLLAMQAPVDTAPAIVYNSPTDGNVPLTPLLGAAANGHTSIVEQLVAAGADPNERREVSTAASAAATKEMHDRSPLQLACQCGHLATVSFLITSGSDVNVVDSHGWTAFMLAVDHSHASVAYKLIEAGAEVATLHPVHGSALHIASKRGLIDVVRYLLHGGNDGPAAASQCSEVHDLINARDSLGATPLLLACGVFKQRPRNDNAAAGVVRLLLDAGADISLSTPAGQSAPAAAKKRRYKKVQAMLEEAAAMVVSPPRVAGQPASEPEQTPLAPRTLLPLLASPASESQQTGVVANLPPLAPAQPLQPLAPLKPSTPVKPSTSQRPPASRPGRRIVSRKAGKAVVEESKQAAVAVQTPLRPHPPARPPPQAAAAASAVGADIGTPSAVQLVG